MNALTYKCRNSATFFSLSVVAFLVSMVPPQVFAQEAKPASVPAQPAGPATEESSKGVFPYLYRNVDSGWYHWNGSASGRSYFYRYADSQWVDFPVNGKEKAYK